MSELHDMAKDLGVDIYAVRSCEECHTTEVRHHYLVAHECLAKLPENCGLIFWPNKQQWAADWTDGTMDGDELIAVGTFIECVIALWKRQKAST